MAFKQVGIRAVIKDYSKFVGGIRGMNDSTNKLTAQIEKQTAVWNRLQGKIEAQVNKLSSFSAKTRRAALDISNLEQKIRTLSARNELLLVQIERQENYLAKLAKSTKTTAIQTAEAEAKLKLMRETSTGYTETLKVMSDQVTKLTQNSKELASERERGGEQLEVMEKDSNLLGIKIDELVDKQNNLSQATSAMSTVMGHADLIIKAAKMTWDNLTWGLRPVIKLVKSIAQSWKDLISTTAKVATSIGSTLISALKAAIPVISKVVIGIGTTLVNAIKSAITFLGKFALSIKDVATNILSFLLSPLKKAVDGIINFFRKAAQVAVGILFAQTIRKMGDALKDFANLAEQGAEEFQVLRIRLEGLVANEIRAADNTIDFARALQMAITPAHDMLTWIQRLAVASPFTRQDIGDTIAFSMAMGFTASEAKTLTEAIGNFTAGMGLGTETMERIVLQFGQMSAAGKLLGTELRDLARGAFVPVNDILERVAAKLGTTATAWRELAARGGTDLRPFFDEFINMAQERFPNAMERMNKTMEAVRQNIHDFVTEFLGVKVLGPAIDRISARAAMALEQLLSPQVMMAFEGLGQSVDRLVEKLFTMTGALSDAVFGPGGIENAAIQVSAFISVVIDAITNSLNIPTEKIGGFVDDLKNTAKNAFDWGANIMISLAKGIIQGATVALQAAMKFVGTILSKWLKGSSPPKVAPNLPVWGKKALTEWLKGMTLADFDVLTAIQGPLRGALDALAGAGRIEDAGMSYAKISRKLIKGIAAGKPLSFFENVLKGTKEFKNELLSLVSAELAYQKALNAAAEAQERLNAANKKFAEQTVEVRRLTQEYNAMLRAGGGDLKGKLAEIQAAEKARNEAEAQIGVEEENLAVAQDAASEAEDRVNLQDQLLQQLIDIASAQNQAGDSAKSMGKKASSAMEDVEDAIDRAMGDFSAFEGEVPGLGKAFEDAKTAIQESLATLFAPLKARWMADVVPALEDLKKAFMDAFITQVPTGEYEKVPMEPGESLVGGEHFKIVPSFTNEFGGVIGNAIKDAFKKIKDWWDETRPLDFIIQGFDNIKTWWDENGPIITAAIGSVINAVTTLSAQLFSGNVGTTPNAVASAWAGTPAAQGPKTRTLADSFAESKVKVMEFKTSMESVVAYVVTEVAYAFGIFKSSITPMYTQGLANIKEAADILMEAMGIGAVAKDGGDANNLRSILKSINWILAQIGGFFLWFSTKVLDFVNDIKAVTDAFNSLADAIWNAVNAKAALGEGGGGGGGSSGFGGAETEEEDVDGEGQHGIHYVPWDGFRAKLHRGERVLTVEQARQYNSIVSAYPVSAPINNNVSFNGGININNGMDMASAQYFLTKAVTGAIRT